MTKIFHLAVGILWMLTACQDSTWQKAQKLEKEIFAIHDSVMPKMGEIISKRKLIEQAMEMDTLQVSTDSLNTLLKAVIKADRDMMNWMHQYKSPNMKSDTALPYLTRQYNKIQHVKKQITEQL
jgi:succinate dehydrogenase flavin-adding protein (antitoxin of CptAB toxin-antitoxin module)